MVRGIGTLTTNLPFPGSSVFLPRGRERDPGNEFVSLKDQCLKRERSFDGVYGGQLTALSIRLMKNQNLSKTKIRHLR